VSPAALFAMGVLVTLVWGAGLSLLVYGAILDGRTDRELATAVPDAVEFPPTSREPDLGRAA